MKKKKLMATYKQIVYQLVFSTKNREKTLIKANREVLFKYIGGILKNNNCHLYRINGIEDHLHIVTSLHPSVALADLIKDIKIASSKMIKAENLFPNFMGWQDGYGAFTYQYNVINELINYVKNQEEHHKKETFVDEYKRLLTEFGIEFDEKYLF
ncbi:MAG: IS200/IS605 family transposase [Bacteroidota bacterium]